MELETLCVGMIIVMIPIAIYWMLYDIYDNLSGNKKRREIKIISKMSKEEYKAYYTDCMANKYGH